MDTFALVYVLSWLVNFESLFSMCVKFELGGPTSVIKFESLIICQSGCCAVYVIGFSGLYRVCVGILCYPAKRSLCCVRARRLIPVLIYLDSEFLLYSPLPQCVKLISGL